MSAFLRTILQIFMKFKTYIIYFSAIFHYLSLFSCSQPQGYPKLKLTSIGLIEIPIDDQTSSTWWFLQSVNLSGEEYLVYHDRIKSKEKYIHFFHLQDNDKSFKVRLSLEGPDGIGGIDGFHVRNLDSIFVLNRFKYEFNLVDTSGNVKDRYRLRNDDSNRPSLETTLPTIWTFAPVIDLGNELVIPANPDIEPFKSNYAQENLCIVLNLETKAFDYRVGYTQKYLNSGFWGVMLEMPSYSVNYKDSLIVQSFPIEDKILVYDFNLNLIKSLSLFNKIYEGNFHSLKDFVLDPEIFYQHIYSNPRNHAIIYDSYRNLYYRIMSEPYPPETINTLINTRSLGIKEKIKYPKRKIMVFDEKFKELGIVELDENKYFVDFIRVTKQGILIEVQTDDENKKTFELFKVNL